MLDVYLIIDIVVIFALLTLALVVLLRNARIQLNRVFFYFVAMISVWIVANYISNDITNSPETALFANRFVFSCSYFAVYFLLQFSISLTEDTSAKKILRYLKIPLIAVGLIAATTLVAGGVHIQDKVYAVDFGWGIAPYGVGLLGMLVGVVVVLRRNIKTTTGALHASVRTLLVSFSVSIPVLVVAQFILPTAIGWFGLTNIGIFAMLGVVYGLYYGVARHRLFDLRPVIVRSFVYVTTLGLLTTIYSVATYYASMAVIYQRNQAVHAAVTTLLVMLILGLYQPMIKAFRRVTNKFFFQDIYDPQTLYTDLNQILVSSVTNLEALLEQSSEIIQNTLGLDYCSIFLHESNDFTSHSQVDKSKAFTNKTKQLLLRGLRSVDSDVVLAERLEKKYQFVKDVLDDERIAAVVCIAISNKRKGEREILGYLMLGAKRSGYSFYYEDVRVLKTVANELSIAIQNTLHYEEIQRFNETLQVKVEEATRKLKATNDKLKRLDEAKDEFVSMASHQLRTPLTSVKGYVSMVLDGDVGPINTQQRELLTRSFNSSQRMSSLISDLLNLSRINTGKFVIERTPVDLAKIVAEEVKQLRDMAEGKQVDLQFTPPESLSQLMLDEGKMHQVIMNFIDNALYYTPAGGKVTVELSETAAAVEFRVIDTGIGVPVESRHRMFSKMFRAPNARKARPDGTGLGLFMVKKVIVAQGGVTIFKTRENKGSTFGFSFPKHGALLVPETAEATSTTSR